MKKIIKIRVVGAGEDSVVIKIQPVVMGNVLDMRNMREDKNSAEKDAERIKDLQEEIADAKKAYNIGVNKIDDIRKELDKIASIIEAKQKELQDILN